MAREAAVTLIPIYTNARHLSDDVQFWCYEFHGAALASVAHCFPHRLTDALLSSTTSCSKVSIEYWGSHPLLDPHYSSSSLRIHHEGIRFTRFDKMKVIADWQAGLDNLRVCTSSTISPGQLNCGKCEKCIRTMLHLLLLGRLDHCAAFPCRDVSPEMLSTVKFKEEWELKYYEPLMEDIRSIGRPDLFQVLTRAIADYHRGKQKREEERRRYEYWMQERGWRGGIRKYDRKYLSGAVTRLIRWIR